MAWEATTVRDIPEGSAEPWGLRMGEGAFPGVQSTEARLPLLGTLPLSLAEDRPLRSLAPQGAAWALLCPSVPRPSTSQGSGALLLRQLAGMSSPQGGKKALSDPSFGKSSGFPRSCSPHTLIPHFPTLLSLSSPSWHAVLPSSLFLDFSASSAMLCSVTAPLPPLPSKTSVLHHPSLLSLH